MIGSLARYLQARFYYIPGGAGFQPSTVVSNNEAKHLSFPKGSPVRQLFTMIFSLPAFFVENGSFATCKYCLANNNLHLSFPDK